MSVNVNILLSPEETHDCILSASRTSTAFRRFPPASWAISRDAEGGRSNFSFRATCDRHSWIYDSLGAATLIRRHRLLIGAISFDVLFAQRMIRIFVIYFSIVRRRAAWASRESESASLMTTTRNTNKCVINKKSRSKRERRLTFELLFCIQIDLLSLSYLFQDLLDNNTVIYSHIALFNRVIQLTIWIRVGIEAHTSE